jgi:hypothetical protein
VVSSAKTTTTVLEVRIDAAVIARNGLAGAAPSGSARHDLANRRRLRCGNMLNSALVEAPVGVPYT